MSAGLREGRRAGGRTSIVAGAAALALPALAGCSVAAGPPTPVLPAAQAALPAGVTVDVYQTRTDLPARRLEIAVRNDGAEDLTVTAAEFVSAQFAGPATWAARPGGTLVRAGFGVDLPVQLPPPACEDPAPLGTVRLRFATASGAPGVVEIPAADRYDRLPVMRAEECASAAIESVAALEIIGPVRTGELGGQPTAFVEIRVTPSGASGDFTIDGVEDTVLLDLRSPDGTSTEYLPLGLHVEGGAPPTSFEIPVLPGRCDAHAIAEDKQGTIFILDVTAPDGTAARVRVASPPETRASIYAFAKAVCGLP